MHLVLSLYYNDVALCGVLSLSFLLSSVVSTIQSFLLFTILYHVADTTNLQRCLLHFAGLTCTVVPSG
jgi:hypothetical protein